MDYHESLASKEAFSLQVLNGVSVCDIAKLCGLLRPRVFWGIIRRRGLDNNLTAGVRGVAYDGKHAHEISTRFKRNNIASLKCRDSPRSITPTGTDKLLLHKSRISAPHSFANRTKNRIHITLYGWGCWRWLRLGLHSCAPERRSRPQRPLFEL